jgi:hypothetical protein
MTGGFLLHIPMLMTNAAPLADMVQTGIADGVLAAALLSLFVK